MKKKAIIGLRLKKSMISNLNTVVAGSPPPPPGSNSCVEQETCFACDVFTVTCRILTCKDCM